MKKLLFLILLGFCLSSPTYADGWVIIDTVGIVNIEIEVDYSDRSEQQLTKVARKVHKIAKKLNERAKYDRIFREIFLHETGINGFIALGPEFEMQENVPQLTGLSINLPTSLFREKIVLKLYEYAISIKQHLYSEEIENLVDSCVLKRAGIIP